jgi:hypothetical protein
MDDRLLRANAALRSKIEALLAEVNSTADSEEAWEIEADKWQARAEAAESLLSEWSGDWHECIDPSGDLISKTNKVLNGAAGEGE